MRIVLLTAPEGDVIARLDHLEGEFLAMQDGQVFYRSPLDTDSWFAAATLAVFRQAAAAWNRYCDDARASDTDEEQQTVVARLQTDLSHIGVLNARADNLWTVLIEQAQHGLL